MTAVQTGLLLFGAALELAGLGLAIVETRDVEHAFRQVFARAGIAQAAATVHGAGFVSNPKGRTPTLEERLDKVEGEVTRLRDELGDRLSGLHQEMRDELRREAESIREDVDFQVGDIRRLLGVSARPTRRRTIGFALFALGLILQTASNFLG